MRVLGAVFFALLAIGPVSAQYGSVGGFGNVVFPGLGHAPAGNPWGNVVMPAFPQSRNATNYSTFPSRLGGVVSGSQPYTGVVAGRRRSSGIYAYPVFVGGGGYGYGGYGYGSGYEESGPAQPNVTVVYPPAQPPVIINQYLGAPPEQGQPPETASSNMHFYQAPASGVESSPSESSYYLIAFKDHSIYSAVAFYVEGDTLHYFTEGNVHNQASLELVDRPLTEQLNRERNVDVRVPR